MKQISIIGATFYGNRGAEGMLSTTVGTLREKFGNEIGFNVFSYYPKSDSQLINEKKVAVFSSTPAYLVLVLFPCALLFQFFGFFRLRVWQQLLPKSVSSLAGSQALICLAGVSFIEGRTKFIPFNIATILPAMVLGVPVIKFAQAMGPFNTQPNRLAAKLFLRCCNQIFTRGETTQSHLEKLLGDSKNYQRADDVAFLFRPEFCISKPALGFKEKLEELASLRKAGKVIVGVCPSVVLSIRAKEAGWDYSARMRELIQELIVQGHSVVLYPNATRGEDMDKTHNNDLPLLEEISCGLRQEMKKKLVIFSSSLNAAQIHKIINSCDVNAVSRFHAMVAALASKVPVMVIGWSHKYLEVMERFSQQDMVLDYKNGSIVPIVECVDKLIAEKFERSKQISATLPNVRALSQVQVKYLFKLLNNHDEYVSP